MEINAVPAATATLTAGVTIVAVLKAASVASTVATVAWTILAITAAAVSIASITAWIHKDAKDTESYFKLMGEHMKVAIAGTYQLVAQTLVQALVQGLAQGVGTAVRRKIAGPDITTEQKHTFA